MQQPIMYGTAHPAREHVEAPKTVVPWKQQLLPKNIFIGTGILLLSMLCIVPIWNSIALLQDDNYVFWAGRSIPIWLIVLCVFLILLYIVTIFTFFAYARASVQTEQTIMMLANIFITMLGLLLMLISLPMSRQSIDTYNNLMHRCDYSEQTHRLYEYSQVLHNIRREPACMAEFSVESCQGYAEASPYTTMLKHMETEFRCSGFCYHTPPAGAASAANVTATPPVPAATLQSGSTRKHHHSDHVSQVSLLASSNRAKTSDSRYPPTLFSDANYQASCDGMAARDMRNFAGDVGFQTFYQGIYLVLIAICTGFLKLIGFCVRKDRESEHLVATRGRA